MTNDEIRALNAKLYELRDHSLEMAQLIEEVVAMVDNTPAPEPTLTDSVEDLMVALKAAVNR